VARVEKGLSKLQGVVEAKVNLATEKATVLFDPHRVQIQDFIRAVKELGYETSMEKIALPVQGMSCAACVRRVEEALGRVEGVLEAKVNLAAERASVSFVPGQATVSDLVRAVERAGYRVIEAPQRRSPGAGKGKQAQGPERLAPQVPCGCGAPGAHAASVLLGALRAHKAPAP
jgi:Cu+-exporting ATPase